MWSVWSETVDLYFGPTLAMLKVDGRGALVMEHENALPVDRLFAELSHAVVNNGELGDNRTRRLRVVLSGGFCSAVTFAVPASVTRWQERMEIAGATAAMALRTTPDQLVCEMDNARAGLASAITKHVMSALQEWATQHRCAIASIQPLWAIASQSRLARDSGVQGLIVVDPDAATVLADDGAGKLVASTLPGPTSMAAGQAGMRRLLVGLGLRESGLLKLGFAMRAGAALPYGPRAWPNHWYSP